MVQDVKGKRFPMSMVSIWLSIFSILLVVNGQCLRHPPYWDGVMGVFFQGQWLYANSFDYDALWRQPDFSSAGPRIYPYNGVALSYGVALESFSPEVINLFAHLIVITLSASVLSLLALIFRRYFSSVDSLVWVAVVGTSPIFSGQTAAMYLEIPLAFFFLLSVYSLSTNRIGLAAAACCFAFAIKPTALLLAVAIATFAVFSRVVGHESAVERRVVDWCLLFSPIVAGSLMFREAAAGASFQHIPISEKFSSLLWTTGGGLFLEAVPLLGGCALSVFVVTKPARRHQIMAQRELFALLSMSAITTWGFWSSLIVMSFPLCRYVVVVTAMNVLFLALLLREFFPPRVYRSVAIGLIVLNSANQYGAWLPDHPQVVARSGERLERSREFLTDIDQCVELCKLVEREFPNEVILARRPFPQMLSMREFGYVQKAHRNVVSVGFHPHGFEARYLPDEAVKPVLRLRPLVIYSPTAFELLANHSLAPPEGSEIIFVRYCNGAPLLLYRPPLPD